MPRPGKKTLLAVAGLCVVLGLAWWQKPRFLGWHYVSQLRQTQDKSPWITRLIALDEAAVGQVSPCFADDEDSNVQAAGAVLAALLRTWGPGDERSARTVASLTQQFPQLPEPGKTAVLEITAGSLQGRDLTPLPMLLQAAHSLLGSASGEHARPELLKLAGALLPYQGDAETLALSTRLAQHGLEGETPPLRTAAIHLLLCEPLCKNRELFNQVKPLLHDGDARVRHAALFALGPCDDIVQTDELLFLLHDDDIRVCQLCELTLQSRGLTPGHILMARLVSDPRPTARLQVLQHLENSPELDPGVWLRRLFADPAPAVRAAAIRASSTHHAANLRQHLQVLSRNDPSPTVRQLAQHYLHQPFGN